MGEPDTQFTDLDQFISGSGDIVMMVNAKPGGPRRGTTAGHTYTLNIDDLRREIDQIDGTIMQLIAQRAEMTKRILGIKRALGMPRHCPERERQILSRINALALQYDLPVNTAEQIFTLILRQYVGVGD